MFAKRIATILAYLGMTRKPQVRESERWVTWLDLSGDPGQMMLAPARAPRRSPMNSHGAHVGRRPLVR